MNVFDLSYVAVLTEAENPSKPLFPEASALLIEYTKNNSFPVALDPNCNLLITVVSATALIKLHKQVKIYAKTKLKKN